MEFKRNTLIAFVRELDYLKLNMFVDRSIKRWNGTGQALWLRS